jgi:hypothetical protein
LHRDLGSRVFDLAEIALGELDGRRRDVFPQTMQLRRPWNRHDPGILRKEPSECDLGERRVLALCDRFEILRQQVGAETVLDKLPDDIDLAGTTAFLVYAKREESGLAFLTTLGSVAFLVLVVLLVSLRRWPLSRWPLRLFLAGTAGSIPPGLSG